MLRSEIFCIHSWRICFFPNNICCEVSYTKNIIAQKFQLSLLIIIYRNKNYPPPLTIICVRYAVAAP